MTKLPFNIPVNVVVGVEVVQTSGASCSYGTSPAPQQRRAFILQDKKINNPKPHVYHLRNVTTYLLRTHVNRQTPCYFTKQASRSRTEPLAM